MCVCGIIYSSQRLLNKKVYPTNLIPFNLSSVLDVVILFAVGTLGTHTRTNTNTHTYTNTNTHTDSAREPHTRWDRFLHLFRQDLYQKDSETGITIIHFSKCHLDGRRVPFLVLMCFSSKLKTFSVHTIPYIISFYYLYSI